MELQEQLDKIIEMRALVEKAYNIAATLDMDVYQCELGVIWDDLAGDQLCLERKIEDLEA